MAGGKRGRFLRRVREDEFPSRVKEAVLGHDSVPASQGASFHRGFRRLRAATYFAHGGKVGKTPPGTAPNEHFVLIVAFPRTPLRGTRTCQVLQCFRRAKFEWLSAAQSGPLGPGYTKILTTALSELRLTLPSQRSWCVSWREPQGAPLRKTEAVLLLS